MLFVFDELLTTLKEAAINDACLSENVVRGMFKKSYYEILNGDNSIFVFCDCFRQNLFAVMFKRVEDSNEYCINMIVTTEPSKYMYARQ